MYSNLGILLGVEFLQRFTYYGMRSIMILFLLNTLDMEKDAAAETYSTFLTIAIIAPLIGGFLADNSKRPIDCAIAGSLMVSLGLFLVSYFPDPHFIQLELYLIAFGCGFSKPPVIVGIYQQLSGKKHLFDIIFTILYLTVTLGAFFGPTIIGINADTGNWTDFSTGFKITLVTSLCSSALLIVFYNRLKYSILSNSNESVKSIVEWMPVTLICLVSSILFWVAYELIPLYFHSVNNVELAVLTVAGLVVFLIIMIPVNAIRRFRSAYKIGLSLIIMMFLVSLAPAGKLDPAITTLCMGAAEVLIGPILISQLLKVAPPRFVGTITGVFLLTNFVASRVAGSLSRMDEAIRNDAIIVLAAALLVFAVMLLVQDRSAKKAEDESSKA